MSSKHGAIVEFKTWSARASITRPANVTAYAVGDVISAAAANGHYTFDEAVEPGTLSGSISTARISSSANQPTKLDAELWLFRIDIAAVADNAAFSITDVELADLIGIIDFPLEDWRVGNAGAGAAGNAVCEAAPSLTFNAAGRAIFGQLVARNAYTPVSGEVFTVELVVTQD